ncbi:MAG TPA: YqeG family HAD IIIA-type phosphatase [Firmicutes bacterium]|nr:YqeG family HAD IIIA-type phosphatase [Candidatus Fermentithermobacillaceae bacterium]
MSDFSTMSRQGPMRLLTPSCRVKSIYDIDLQWLKARSIQGIISDLDNTLVPWRDYSVARELKDWFRQLHDEGFRTVILTNARPAPTVEKLASELETGLVVGARKPIIRYFRYALELLGTQPHSTCVIGDQIFTDVLGGNLVGCHTILVDRIGNREFVGTRFMRLLEKLVLARLGERSSCSRNDR